MKLAGTLEASEPVEIMIACPLGTIDAVEDEGRVVGGINLCPNEFPRVYRRENYL
jgi:hypothetical protein